MKKRLALPRWHATGVGVLAWSDEERKIQAQAQLSTEQDENIVALASDKLLCLIEVTSSGCSDITRDGVELAVTSWDDECTELESPITVFAEKNPSAIIELVQREQEVLDSQAWKIEEEIEEIATSEVIEEVFESHKRSHENLKKEAVSLEEMVLGSEQTVTREVRSKLIKALRIASAQVTEAKPSKRQRTIFEFFRPTS